MNSVGNYLSGFIKAFHAIGGQRSEPTEPFKHVKNEEYDLVVTVFVEKKQNCCFNNNQC